MSYDNAENAMEYIHDLETRLDSSQARIKVLEADIEKMARDSDAEFARLTGVVFDHFARIKVLEEALGEIAEYKRGLEMAPAEYENCFNEGDRDALICIARFALGKETT